MATLADLEVSLALFTEGMAGRYLHIRAAGEFALDSRLGLSLELADGGSGQSQDTLFLPEHLDYATDSAYRVLVMQQLGLRECGTLKFRLATALAELPALAERYATPANATPRTGDYQLLFSGFSRPKLAERLFLLFEQARIQNFLLSAYPGLARHLHAYQEHILQQTPLQEELLEEAQRWLFGDALSPWGEELPLWRDLYTSLRTALNRQDTVTSVYTSVQGLCDHYDVVAEHYALMDPENNKDGSLLDWLNREQRIEDWEEDLKEIEQHDNVPTIADQPPTGKDVEAVHGESGEGQFRKADIDIKILQDEKDTLKRRIDMEKSAVQHALGTDRSDARSFRYDEWDYLNRRYLRAWCRVFESPLIPTVDTDTESLKRVIRTFQPIVQKQLEHIRPSGLERVKRVQDGDELDIEAIIEARQDVRAGQSPNERVYSRKERLQRDVCAAFLVDLSASTDDPIIPPEPTDWSNYPEDEEVDFRAGWYAALDEETEPSEPGRKIIDLERDAMVVMAAALDALGDQYGIYGFSGYSKDCVDIYLAKEIADAFSMEVLKKIAAMQPKGSTRMGPAIRHCTHKLTASGHAMKVLIVISDGFPQDSDYGPERGNHDYGVEDTAKALQEAQQKGIETFCMTVDKSGHDYLKRMCPDARYMVIEEMEDLPDQLTKVYTALTTR
tara:strand:- start:2473 stop:4491 length:2019 start_codon:yes stop_codon:yes gene_type:complete